MAVSLAPKDASKGVGIQEGDYRITGATVVNHQYDPNKETGEQTPAFCAMKLALQPLHDGEPAGEEVSEYFKVGKIGTFQPSEDGESGLGDDLDAEGPFVFNEHGYSPNDRSKFMVFAAEAVNQGFSEDKLSEGDVRCFIGVEGFITLKKQPGIQGGKEYSVPVFSKIYTLGAAKGKAAGKVKADKAKTKKSGIPELARAVVDSVLSATSATMTMAKFNAKVSAHCMRDTDAKPHKAEIVAFIKSGDGMEMLEEAAVDNSYSFDSDDGFEYEG